MAEVCNCCGKNISFFSVDFDVIEIDKEDYKICSICNNNFVAYKNGNIPLEELVSECTNPKLKNYLEQYILGEKNQNEVLQRETQKKLIEQKNKPLYDDIHQIAGDLRFIKNLITIGIVFAFVSGIITIFGMM